MSSSKVISDEDIDRLPRWAKLALLARFSRRWLSVIPTLWERVPGDQLKGLSRGVAAAEARAANPSEVTAHLASAAATDIAATQWTDLPRKDFHASLVVSKGIQAIRSATAAAATSDPRKVPGTCYLVLLMSLNNLETDLLYPHFRLVVPPAFRADYERLANAAARDGWTDDTPVPPEFFGPLWPDEIVAGLPEVAAVGPWLRDLMGEHEGRAHVRWSFDGTEGFPTGVRVAVGVDEWGIAERRAFTWGQFRDEDYLKGALATLWSKVRTRRSQAILADVGLPEAV